MTDHTRTHENNKHMLILALVLVRCMYVILERSYMKN